MLLVCAALAFAALIFAVWWMFRRSPVFSDKVLILCIAVAAAVFFIALLLDYIALWRGEASFRMPVTVSQRTAQGKYGRNRVEVITENGRTYRGMGKLRYYVGKTYFTCEGVFTALPRTGILLNLSAYGSWSAESFHFAFVPGPREPVDLYNYHENLTELILLVFIALVVVAAYIYIKRAWSGES